MSTLRGNGYLHNVHPMEAEAEYILYCAILLLAHKGLWVIFESPEHSVGAVEALSTEQLKQLPAHTTPVQSCMYCSFVYMCVCAYICESPSSPSSPLNSTTNNLHQSAVLNPLVAFRDCKHAGTELYIHVEHRE